MTDRFRTLTAVAALVAATVTSAAYADKGPGGPGDMLLNMFDSIDTDKDGKITEAEMDAHRSAEFAKADTNSDGMLSAEELTAKQVAEMTEAAKDRAAKMIADKDDNADGNLSPEEMIETVQDRRFDRLDQDDDGAVSKAEAEAALKRFADGRKKRHHKDDDQIEN